MISNRLKTITRYQLYSLTFSTIIMALVLIINLVLGIILKLNGEQGGSIDLPVFITAIIWGYVFFGDVFNFGIINGVSRKSYFISTIFSFFISTVALAIVTTIFAVISRQFAENIIVYFNIYPSNVLAMFFWFWAVIIFMIALGWFLAIMFYSISKKTKFVLIGIFAVLAPVIMVLNHYVGGIIETLKKFGLMFLGVFNNTVNSYLSVLMLSGLAIILVVATWLFLRKMELK